MQTILPFRETGGSNQGNHRHVLAAKRQKPQQSQHIGKDEEDWGVKPDKGFDLPLPVKDLYDLQDHQRDREIIARPGGKTQAVNASFQDKQLDMALDYLRGQIKLANQGGSTKKAGG